MFPVPADDTGLYCLTVGNGITWRLRPVGNEATDVVERLAGVMCLSRCSQGPEILVMVPEGAWQIPVLPGDPATGICLLPPGENEAMKIIQMTRCATTIASHMLQQGGFLIHGGLVEKDGCGVILAGPGTVGKSTACCRIPLPWHALSDDATLVISDGNGRYLAYPWPTWSRFFDNGPGGRWDVRTAVPLKALFFLHQSPEDRIEPVNRTLSTAWVVESTHQAMGPQMRSRQELSDAKEIYTLELRAAERLVHSIPVGLLHISLTGNFWEKIEGALPGMTSGLPEDIQINSETGELSHSDPPSAWILAPGHIPVLYTGPSMNPVLREQDLLDVLPYGTDSAHVGDVICFRTPEQLVVHRIIGIGRDGIRTQGDNNPTPDPFLHHPENILGRVVAASRGRVSRNIPGGNTGRMIRRFVCLRKQVIVISGLLIRIAQPLLSASRIIIRCFVPGMNPRVILFSTRYFRILRLFIGTRLAGEYDSRKKCWSLKFPFQFVIDKNHLPVIEPAVRPNVRNSPVETIQSAR